MSDTRKVIIIGSGPAGYTAAIYAARAGLEPLVIAGSVTAGGALMTTTEVENFPGFVEGIQGPELMDTLQAQAEKFGAEVLFDDVSEVSLVGPAKTATTATGKSFSAEAIILATGSAYRELGLPNEKRLSGKGVSWCATCDGFFFKEQDVVVVGGGDSAVEEATFLTRFAKRVRIIHRRDELRASKFMVDRAMNDPKIEFVWDSEVIEVEGEDKVTGVRINNVKTGEETLLEATGMFVAIGHDPRNELLNGVVDLDDAGYVKVQGRTTLTNVEGVFACGDLVDSHYRQAITAAGSGCAAALDAGHYLDDLADGVTKEPVKAVANSAASIPGATASVPAAPTAPIHSTDADFEKDVIKSDLPVVVDFWAEWCGPCRAVAPILDELAGEYAGRIKIVKIDTDANPESAMAYGVTSIPTMNFYKGGDLVKSITGARPKPALTKLFDEVLG